MFDVIARRYDRFTRLFSFGMDAGWKRQLMERLDPDTQADLVVDLACGTGDFAAHAAQRWPQATVLGMDVSRHMIVLAAQRSVPRSRVRFGAGDMIDLPLPSQSVDVVTVGYGIRNAPTPARALDEIARVLRPGGSLLVLDFYRPSVPVWRTLFPWYLRTAGNLVGWLWHREPVAYGYIGPSVARYLTAREFEEAAGAHGFTVHYARRKLLGGIALHIAVRQ
jgi:demethylmenaquinone methyltransferase/2-methoxy-6-polyprenyl-1,4-benzoquinol methylase